MLTACLGTTATPHQALSNAKQALIRVEQHLQQAQKAQKGQQVSAQDSSDYSLAKAKLAEAEQAISAGKNQQAIQRIESSTALSQAILLRNQTLEQGQSQNNVRFRY